jgi:hypothetical protein
MEKLLISKELVNEVIRITQKSKKERLEIC